MSACSAGVVDRGSHDDCGGKWLAKWKRALVLHRQLLLLLLLRCYVRLGVRRYELKGAQCLTRARSGVARQSAEG